MAVASSGPGPSLPYRHLPRSLRERPDLGLYGGSFDPIHSGHWHVLRAALERGGVEHLVLVPTGHSPFKGQRAPAPGMTRLALILVALRSLPAPLARRVSVWTTELHRSGPCFTVDTLRELAAVRGGAVPPPHLVLGQDSLDGLPRWREVHEVLARCRPVVVQRTPRPDLAASLAALAAQLPSAALERLRAGALPLADPSPVSATDLRRRLSAGEDPGDELPPLVFDKIVGCGFYGAPRRGAP
jgi:nicotinate-nucleotide adenylyltransferase